MFFFFFQAEDGIRDYKVTGVQTCALPIWAEGAHADSLLWGENAARPSCSPTRLPGTPRAVYRTPPVGFRPRGRDPGAGRPGGEGCVNTPAAAPFRARGGRAVRHPRAMAYGEGPGPIAIAHRGGAGLGVENSMQAFARSTALGVRYLETDVRVTADGELVCFHDATLDRVTGRS